MRWESLNSTAGHQEYALWNDDQKVLTLTFHPATNSARIESATERRVFLIRNEGFLKTKTVMRSEYGIKIGQLVSGNKENVVELDNERFFYLIQTAPKKQVIIYKESKENPFAVCNLDIDSAHFSKNRRLPASLESSLLLSLCWQLFTPIKEEALDYAV